MSLRIGEAAPDFSAQGVDCRVGERRVYRLSDHLGAPVVLVFYPADDTPVCTEQLRSYTAGIARLDELATTVFAISPQSVESHERFSASHGGFGFPMLSDPDKSIGERYGILGLLDLYRRSIFVIDSAGAIVYTHRAVGPGLEFVPLESIINAVATAA